MSERFQGVPERTVALALAVNPFDARTGEPLREDATVSVEGVHAEPRLNPTGYWLFLDPPAESVPDPPTVTVTPSSRYIERTVEAEVDDDEPPATRVAMYPSTEYAFPAGTTCVEGTVERTVSNGPNEPVAGATVAVRETDLETRTGSDGGFVLALEDVATTESMREGDFVRVESDDGGSNGEPENPRPVEVYTGGSDTETPTLDVTHATHGQTDVEQAFTEGERRVRESPIVL